MKHVRRVFLLVLITFFLINSVSFLQSAQDVLTQRQATVASGVPQPLNQRSTAVQPGQAKLVQPSVEQTIQRIKADLPDAKWVDLPKERQGGVKPQYKFEIEFPKLGTFVLEGDISLETMDFRFDGSLKELKPLELGPLVLFPPKATLSKQAGFQIEGSASLFDLKFTFKLEKFIPGQDVIFSLEGPAPLVIPITPWKKLEFKKLYLSFGVKAKEVPVFAQQAQAAGASVTAPQAAQAPKSPVQTRSQMTTTTIGTKKKLIFTEKLFTRTSLFSPKGEEDVELSIGLEQLDGFVEVKIKEIKPSFIIPLFQGTPLDNIVVKNIMLRVSNFLKNPTLTIGGTSDLTSLAKILPIKLELGDLVTSIAVSAAGDVIFNAQLAQTTPIHPFKGIGVKELEDIMLYNVSLGFDLKKRLFYLQGTSSVLNIATTASFLLSPERIVLVAKLAEGWKLSQAIPAIKGTPLDALDFTKSKLVVTSNPYFDPELRVEFKRGINLVADIPLVEFALNSLPDLQMRTSFGQVFRGIPPSLQLVGSIGPSLPDLMFMINLPLSLKLFDFPDGPALYFNKCAVQIRGDGPSAAALVQVGFRPTAKDEMLRFTGKLQVGVETASLSASMQGTWVDPLGIATLLRLKRDRLAIFDCALECGFDYKVVQACIASIKVPLPTVFGLTGGIKIGDAVAQMAIKASTSLLDLALLAKLVKQTKDKATGQIKEEMIRLKDLVMFANELGIPIPVNNIPEFGVMGELRFCPKGVTIGEIYIDPGITVKGQIIMPNLIKLIDPKAPENFSAMVDMSLSLNGLVAKGTMSRIVIQDWFELTGVGLDKKYGTTDDGITFSMELTPKNQEFFMSGKLKIGNDKWGIFKTDSQTECIFDKKGMKFFTETNLFGGKIHIKLVAQSIGQDLLTMQDFVVHGDFKDDFSGFVEQEILKFIDTLQINVKRDFDGAIQAVKNEEAKVAQLQTQIDVLYAKYKKEHGAAAQAVIALTEAQRNVDTINLEIDRTQKELNAVPWWDPFKKMFLGGKIATLWIGHKVAMGALQLAKVTVGRFTALPPEIPALETAEFTAREALRFARGVVENIKEEMLDVGDAGKD
ncbi:MAG: hypothetical protein V1855_02630, partial [bacterium]